MQILYSPEHMHLFNYIKAEMKVNTMCSELIFIHFIQQHIEPELIAIIKGKTNSNLHKIHWHGSKSEKSNRWKDGRMRNSLPCVRLQRGRTLVKSSMETIAHARKHQGDVVVSLKVNHTLAIAMEGDHALAIAMEGGHTLAIAMEGGHALATAMEGGHAL